MARTGRPKKPKYKHSEETKRKIANSVSEWYARKYYRTGTPIVRSEETKALMSQRRKEWWARKRAAAQEDEKAQLRKDVEEAWPQLKDGMEYLSDK